MKLPIVTVLALVAVSASCTPAAAPGCVSPDATTAQPAAAAAPCPRSPDAGHRPDVVVPAPAPTSPAGVCAHLAALKCPEGLAADCLSVLSHAVGGRVVEVNVTCLAAAETVEAVRACGVSCS